MQTKPVDLDALALADALDECPYMHTFAVMGAEDPPMLYKRVRDLALTLAAELRDARAALRGYDLDESVRDAIAAAIRARKEGDHG